MATQWPGSFLGEVVVRNNSGVSTRRWTAHLRFPDGQRITQTRIAEVTGAEVTGSGPEATAVSSGYNRAGRHRARPRGFGVIAGWNGTTNSAPAVPCTVR